MSLTILYNGPGGSPPPPTGTVIGEKTVIFTTQYATARQIRIPIIKHGSSDFAQSFDWTPAAGDVVIMKDGGSPVAVTNLPTPVTVGNSTTWLFSLTATEMIANQIVIMIADAVPKAVEDTVIEILTYGNPSANLVTNFAQQWAVPGDQMALTPAAQTNVANSLLDLTNSIETGLTLRQAMRLMTTILGGVLSGANTNLISILSAVSGSTVRVQATVDQNGNRNIIIVNLN